MGWLKNWPDSLRDSDTCCEGDMFCFKNCESLNALLWCSADNGSYAQTDPNLSTSVSSLCLRIAWLEKAPSSSCLLRGVQSRRFPFLCIKLRNGLCSKAWSSGHESPRWAARLQAGRRLLSSPWHGAWSTHLEVKNLILRRRKSFLHGCLSEIPGCCLSSSTFSRHHWAMLKLMEKPKVPPLWWATTWDPKQKKSSACHHVLSVQETGKGQV